MRDLLGRELKDGDMCIGMAIGRNSPGMHLGIFQGSSVVYLSYNEEYINRNILAICKWRFAYRPCSK